MLKKICSPVAALGLLMAFFTSVIVQADMITEYAERKAKNPELQLQKLCAKRIERQLTAMRADAIHVIQESANSKIVESEPGEDGILFRFENGDLCAIRIGDGGKRDKIVALGIQPLDCFSSNGLSVVKPFAFKTIEQPAACNY